MNKYNFIEYIPLHRSYSISYMLPSEDAFTPFEYSWMVMNFMVYFNAAFFVVWQALFPFPLIYKKT